MVYDPTTPVAERGPFTLCSLKVRALRVVSGDHPAIFGQKGQWTVSLRVKKTATLYQRTHTFAGCFSFES